MKIGFLLSSVSRQAGGLFESVRRLAQSVLTADCTIKVFAGGDGFTAQDIEAWRPLTPATFRVFGPAQFGYLPGLARALRGQELDLINLHGIWMYPSVASLSWSRRSHKPVVIHPHGMLDDWAVRRHRWKKVLAGWAYENRHLRRAHCLRALNASEADAIRRYGLKNPVCVVPNGIDLPGPAPAGPAPWEAKVEPGRRVLLFLGRLHAKKGLAQLLAAWHLLRQKQFKPLDGWVAAVAGWEQEGHEAELRAQVDRLGLSRDVVFLGPRFGPDKAACFARSAAFVLPSFSEGMPMAVLEAWAYGLPVVLTPYCNLPEGQQEGAAVVVEPREDDIARGLAELMEMSDAQRQEMGRRGRQLVLREFTWPRIAGQMRAVYRWLLGSGGMPDHVRCA
jgi:poly(glycerol-phosphate) alpha-glucosyltransferase